MAILGLPKKEQLQNMSSQMTSETIKLVHRLDDMPKRDFKTILPSQLDDRDKERAADLLEKLL